MADPHCTAYLEYALIEPGDVAGGAPTEFLKGSPAPRMRSLSVIFKG